MNKNVTNRRLGIIATITVILSPVNGHAAIVPIPSIVHYKCPGPGADVKYTATPYPDDILNQLVAMNYTGANGFGVKSPTTGTYFTGNDLRGLAPAEKLREINRMIFNTETPAAGRQVIRGEFIPSLCNTPPQAVTCYGVFVHTVYGSHTAFAPDTFPSGTCAVGATTPVTCSFTQADALVDLGSGGVGARQGSAAIQLSCSQPSSYRISLSPSHSDDHGIAVKSLTVQGHDLPYVGTASGQQESVTISVEALVSEVGRQSTNRVLLIDIP